MNKIAIYQIEVSGFVADVTVDADENSIAIEVKVNGKTLTDLNLGPAETEALRRFFTE
jgi:hypothetical protein